MKRRADVRLVADGLAESREKARRMILEGRIFAAGRPVRKPSEAVEDHEAVSVSGGIPDEPVGRGALKLEKALSCFGICVAGAAYLDIGASTGGFTECLLRHGAARVYAVDVGRGQLHEKLRNDPRVRVMEGTNARNLTAEDFPERPDGAVMDVSFISVLKIAPALYGLLPDDGPLIALIKPQFEAGPDRVGKNGVVRDPQIHRSVLREVTGGMAAAGFGTLSLDYSPIRGQRGNIEFLLYARKTNAATAPYDEKAISALVEAAHAGLGRV